MKKIIGIASILMALFVLSLVVIHVTPYNSNKATQFDIPEKPAGIEELAPCIDVTSRIRNPIEIAKENQIMFIANAD